MAVKEWCILVVDDEPDILDLFRNFLADEGYSVLLASGVEEAMVIVDTEPVDLVITDLALRGASGLELLQHLTLQHPDISTIMITGYASIETAVKAMSLGALEYMTKPLNMDRLLPMVRKALEQRRLRGVARSIPEKTIVSQYGLIGESLAMRRVAEAIEKVAETPMSVLITGESGTGKELVARAIHYNSGRASGPFVPVNCGGIPESLFESEFFGHTKGAFTGALQDRQGYFQAGEGGTLFLDEVAEIGENAQARLLRALEDKHVIPVGSHEGRTVDVRVLAATNKDLRHLTGRGRFREDLFYRLNVLTIELPPLREREDDILLLAHHFAGEMAHKLDRTPPAFSLDLLTAFKSYPWPGNVRELRNLVQSMVVMGGGEELEMADLPEHMVEGPRFEQRVDRTLAEVEMEHILKVLAHTDGNKKRAAEILGIDRKTLDRKLRSQL